MAHTLPTNESSAAEAPSSSSPKVSKVTLVSVSGFSSKFLKGAPHSAASVRAFSANPGSALLRRVNLTDNDGVRIRCRSGRRLRGAAVAGHVHVPRRVPAARAPRDHADLAVSDIMAKPGRPATAPPCGHCSHRPLSRRTRRDGDLLHARTGRQHLTRAPRPTRCRPRPRHGVPRRRASRRAPWLLAPVIPDEVPSTVLACGLRPDGEGWWERAKHHAEIHLTPRPAFYAAEPPRSNAHPHL